MAVLHVNEAIFNRLSDTGVLFRFKNADYPTLLCFEGPKIDP